MKIDPAIRNRCEKIMSDYHIGCYGLNSNKKMSNKDCDDLQKLNDIFKLQLYLLMDFPEIELGYNYMKELNMNVDTFIYEFSLDKIIVMKPKDFLKYDRNIRKKYNDILKLLKYKNTNKQQQIKLQKKMKSFLKKQLDFYKNILNIVKNHI